MVEMGSIELKGEFIAFAFEEHVNVNGLFDEVGTGLIYIPRNSSHQKSANSPRWGSVIKIGPDVKDNAIVPGARILVAPLRWSFGITAEDGVEKFHITKESEIWAVE